MPFLVQKFLSKPQWFFSHKHLRGVLKFGDLVPFSVFKAIWIDGQWKGRTSGLWFNFRDLILLQQVKHKQQHWSFPPLSFLLIKQQLCLQKQHPTPDINSSSRSFISPNCMSSVPGYCLHFWASFISSFSALIHVNSRWYADLAVVLLLQLFLFNQTWKPALKFSSFLIFSAWISSSSFTL